MSVPVAENLSTGRVVALIGSLALVVAPHAVRIPAWIAIIAAGVMILRAVLAWRGHGLPPPRLLVVLAIGSILGIWLSFGMLFNRDAAVALLVLMLCLKMLELRTLRDAVVLVLLGYFLVITNFLYSQTLPMALYLLGCVWLITACLIAFQYRTATADPRPTLRMSGLMLAQAIPLMLVFFLLFPRVQGPLWGLPQASASALSGLSDSMSPGSLSHLSLSDAVAFRVEFDSPPPKPNKLYWRGPVLWDFDGRTWRGGDSAPRAGREIETASPPIRYTVTLEPHNMRWMFAIDLPAQRLEGALQTQDFQLLSIRPVRTRQRYAMSSYLDYRYGASEPRRNLARALQLPEGFNPRARRLAAELYARSSTPAEVVNTVLALFRGQPFYYTLVPPELGRDSIDEFLFETRRGFCEHFAASFVFLMRAAGVPARIVTGYQGGVLNPIGNYLIVRQSEAHAWAEVWLGDDGWVRVDPTAAVSPLRIEAGIARAVPAGDPLPLMVRTDSELLKRLRFSWDAAANGWNQWVLGYTPERQMQMLQRAGFTRPNWQNLAVALMAVTSFVTAILCMLLLARLRRRGPDPIQSPWLALQAKLARIGLGPCPGEGPVHWSDRAATALPVDTAEHLRGLADLYVQLRYGRDGAKGREVAALRRGVRALRV